MCPFPQYHFQSFLFVPGSNQILPSVTQRQSSSSLLGVCEFTSTHVPLAMCALSERSSASSSSLTVSLSRTLCSAGVSSPATSCSTCRMEMWAGTRRLRHASIFSSVVLPRPFLPTKPYLRPLAKHSSAPCSRDLRQMYTSLHGYSFY